MRRFKNNYEKNRNVQRAQRGGDRRPPKPAIRTDPAEELLRERAELRAFGVEWVRAWVPYTRERLVGIAKVMRRFLWMVGVVKQRPVSNPHTYVVEVYVARDGSEACLALNQLKAFYARGGVARGSSWSWSSAGMKYMRGR